MSGLDEFQGDNARLIECIKALLDLDAANALVPHGIGGHARTLLAASAARLGVRLSHDLLPNDAEALRLAREVMGGSYHEPGQQQAAIQCVILEGMRLALSAASQEPSASVAPDLMSALRSAESALDEAYPGYIPGSRPYEEGEAAIKSALNEVRAALSALSKDTPVSGADKYAAGWRKHHADSLRDKDIDRDDTIWFFSEATGKQPYLGIWADRPPTAYFWWQYANVPAPPASLSRPQTEEKA